VSSVKVGVIGTGHLGRYHALKYTGNKSADLVGVADVDYEKAMQVAEEAGCRAYETPADLLKEVEAVSIAVPTDKHLESGLRAINAGVHCLIEKPIASTQAEAEQLVNAASEKGVILQVGHIERFNPALLSLTGVALEPLFIEAHRLAPFTPRGTEVAVVLDLMIHDLDVILHMIDSPVKSVQASDAENENFSEGYLYIDRFQWKVIGGL